MKKKLFTENARKKTVKMACHYYILSNLRCNPVIGVPLQTVNRSIVTI